MEFLAGDSKLLKKQYTKSIFFLQSIIHISLSMVWDSYYQMIKTGLIIKAVGNSFTDWIFHISWEIAFITFFLYLLYIDQHILIGVEQKTLYAKAIKGSYFNTHHIFGSLDRPGRDKLSISF